jgi:general secretion pathway protein D
MMYKIAVFSIVFFQLLDASQQQSRLFAEVEKVEQKINKKSRRKERMLWLQFDNEDLTKFIHLIAQEKGINILLPQGGEAITQKITFKVAEKVPLSKAEEYLSLFLRMAGYGMVKEGDLYVITKVEPYLNRSPLPLYVNISPDELPKSRDIRAIYYLSNLKVPENTQSADPITLLLRDLLTTTASFMYDPKSNGIIISDRSDNIAAVMTILLELDSSGNKEVVDLVELFHSSARTVAALLKEQILAVTTDPRTAGRTDIKTDSSLYFAPNTRVVAIESMNSIAILGNKSAVERLREFIRLELDTPPESGDSILHHIDLQYLDAESFAKVLQNVVTTEGGGAQSQKDTSGPRQFFQGVKILAETYQAAEQAKAVEGQTASVPQQQALGTVYFGGNRLIVAARKKDFERIQELVKKLDRPEPQVIVEVMILDITTEDDRVLAAQTRNPSGLPLPPGVEFQTAQITGPILNNTQTSPPNATTLAADLLRILLNTTPPTSQATTISTNNPGSIIFALNDPNGSGIWSLITVLQSMVKTKFIANPYLVMLNNTKSEVSNIVIKQAAGNQSIGEGAVSTVKQQDFEAKLLLSLVSRISSETRVNLQINLEIEAFNNVQSATDFTRQTRKLQTSAYLASGEVMAFGGLSIYSVREAEGLWPILGRIPVIGWLARGQQKFTTRNNLLVFISPTIVQPRVRQGQARYTDDKVIRGYVEMPEYLPFDVPKDPITRWFFRDDIKADREFMTTYLDNARETSNPSGDTRYLQNDILRERLAAERNPLTAEKQRDLQKETVSGPSSIEQSKAEPLIEQPSEVAPEQAKIEQLQPQIITQGQDIEDRSEEVNIRLSAP